MWSQTSNKKETLHKQQIFISRQARGNSLWIHGELYQHTSKQDVLKQRSFSLASRSISLRTADAFPVVASLPPKNRRERSDDRKCVCCSQATRCICVDCLVIGRQVSQYRRPKHSLWLNKRYIWNGETKIVKRSTQQRYRRLHQRNTSLSNVVQLSRPCWTDRITCVRKLDNIVWSDASWDIWNSPRSYHHPCLVRFRQGIMSEKLDTAVDTVTSLVSRCKNDFPDWKRRKRETNFIGQVAYVEKLRRQSTITQQPSAV